MNTLTAALTAVSLLFSGALAAHTVRHPKTPRSHHSRELTQAQRDKIMREIEFATQKMYRSMSSAEREADKVYSIDYREAAKDAIKGAVAGVVAGPKAVVIGACLGALGSMAAESCDHWLRMERHVRDAEGYAAHADRLEEQLWNG